MKARIKFSKFGNVRFIGHLDTMRYFQKAVKRAGLDMSYTLGFNPHPIMSFALPLGVGVTSDGEYIDIQVNSMPKSKDAIEALNLEMTDGFKVTGFVALPDDAKKGMTLVGASDYEITINSEYNFPMSKNQWIGIKTEFIDNHDAIEIEKEGKNTTKIVDIKPFIYSFAAEYNDDNPMNSKLIMRLAAGSKNNLKPEYVLEAAFKFYNIEFSKDMIHIHRTELLDENMLSLKELGKEVE